MRTHKMTKWEAGQDLISCADLLAEKEVDLEHAGFKDLAKVLLKTRLMIGDEFNKLNSHDFDLPGLEEE